MDTDRGQKPKGASYANRCNANFITPKNLTAGMQRALTRHKAPTQCARHFGTAKLGVPTLPCAELKCSLIDRRTKCFILRVFPFVNVRSTQSDTKCEQGGVMCQIFHIGLVS